MTAKPVQYFPDGVETISAATFIEEVLPTWDDSSATWIRDGASSLRCLARAADKPLSAIMMTHDGIASAIRLMERRRRCLSVNQRSLLTCMVRRLADRSVGQTSMKPLTPAWQALYDLLSSGPESLTFLLWGLIRFMRFCSEAGFEPALVGIQTLQAFEAHLAAHAVTLDPARLARSTAKSWNRAARTISGWPSVTLSRRQSNRSVTRPLTDYPLPFQKGVAAFMEHLACATLTGLGPTGSNPYRRLLDPINGRHGKARGRTRPAKPATIKMRMHQMLVAAAALVKSRYDITAMLSPGCLVDPPEHVKMIANLEWDRTGKRPSTQMAGLLDLLRQVARFSNAPDTTIELITDLLAKATPPRQQSMTVKNARRLQQLAIVENRAALLHLPAALMRLADGCDDPKEGALHALQAAALEILLICPMRLSNLQKLRVGIELRNLEDRRFGAAVFNLEIEQTKNESSLLWPIPEDSRRLICRYYTHYRPHLAADGNGFLFPGVAQRSRSINAMRDAIEKPTSWLGLEVNPHLLRHFAVWLFLKTHPGQYEMARRILGHKRIETTIRYYAGLEAQFAAKLFDKTLFDERRGTRNLAKGLLARALSSHVPGGKK